MRRLYLYSLVVAASLLIAACGREDAVAVSPAAPPLGANAGAARATPKPPVLQLPTPLTQRRPVATPPPATGLPEAISAPPDHFGEVAASYSASREAILKVGRNVVGRLITGDAGAVFDRFSRSSNGNVRRDSSRVAFETSLRQLLKDRVHFELTDGKTVFDGHLNGGRITGKFGESGAFVLERRDTDGDGDFQEPIAGHWEGTLDFGDRRAPFMVDFKTEGDGLKATLDIPQNDVKELPLSEVSYDERLEIGERVAERVLPMSPNSGAYDVGHAWGARTLWFLTTMNGAGALTDVTWITTLKPLSVDAAPGLTTEARWRLPFDGLWWVQWGGHTEFQNYHVVHPRQRYAYDFVVWKEGGKFRGDGARNEDYWTWGQLALAPAPGVVVMALDGIQDNVPGQNDRVSHPAGNHVVIRTGKDEYVFVALLQNGSVRVEQGDEVEAGDVLGLAGNSGFSSEPHIHIHVQSRAELLDDEAIGLPLAFSDYMANGAIVEKGVPVQGEFIKHRRK